MVREIFGRKRQEVTGDFGAKICTPHRQYGDQMKGDEMGGVCGTNRGNRVGKPEGMGQRGRSGRG